MITFQQAFGGGGGGGAAPGGWAMPIFVSHSFTISQAGFLVATIVAAGGGGGQKTGASSGFGYGGNSGPWGRKVFEVSAGDAIQAVIGAGGAGGAAIGGSGSAGGLTSLSLNAVSILSAAGGEGGLSSGVLVPPTPASSEVVGADFWTKGVAPITFTGGNQITGGSAVDVFMTGLGRGILNGGGSIGTDAGGIPTPWIALSDFGFVVTDGSLATPLVGVPGRGGESSTIKAGHLAGGGAASVGGIGGGGGGGGGRGGDGYLYLVFTPKG